MFCRTETFLGPTEIRVRSLFATQTAVSRLFVLTKIKFQAQSPPPHFCKSCLSIAFIMPHFSLEFRFLKRANRTPSGTSCLFVRCVVPDVSTYISASIFRVRQSRKNRYIS